MIADAGERTYLKEIHSKYFPRPTDPGFTPNKAHSAEVHRVAVARTNTTATESDLHAARARIYFVNSAQYAAVINVTGRAIYAFIGNRRYKQVA